MNSDSVIPHCESKSTTSTQYVMSGSSPVISRVKGGSQVRERVESEATIVKATTEDRKPKVH